ncbi:hypothetical protein [Candidatus Phycosocius spiralis]|uniref:Uncharacterized protein n=1 Tax=Candidatus Phycosocius spiralis TaxID=2815099 RepID=A0ABQ4PX80_9PROT|nr:hypothetical protein [Candidatus Phycosocius spiralis]GIU67564.1 hypothetical protein PsB1_1718 [Candidatus Phycosocius spiralis]
MNYDISDALNFLRAQILQFVSNRSSMAHVRAVLNEAVLKDNATPLDPDL